MSVFDVSIGSTDDLETLVRHRIGMWLELFPDLKERVIQSESETRQWILRKIKAGELIPFIARAASSEVAASGCLLIREDQPRPNCKGLYVPYLMSMFTEHGHRNKGAANSIVSAAISWSKARGYDRMLLHASSMGRAIYEKFGFTGTNEMRLFF